MTGSDPRYAGTRAFVAGNWPVETSAARMLTTSIFGRQAASRNRTGAQALRLAEIELTDDPGTVDPATRRTLFSFAHPIC